MHTRNVSSIVSQFYSSFKACLIFPLWKNFLKSLDLMVLFFHTLYYCLSWSVRAALAKLQTGGLWTTGIDFLQFFWLGSSGSCSCRLVVWGRPSSSWTASSQDNPPCWTAQDISQGLLYDANPLPLCLSYLPKAPSSTTITLGLGSQCVNLRRMLGWLPLTLFVLALGHLSPF